MARSLLLPLALALVAPAAAAPGLGGKVPWGNDMATALRLAKEQKKPVVLLFTAEDAGCVKLAAGPLSDDSVVEAFKAVVPLLIDCTGNLNAELRERTKVTTLPALVYFDHEGRPLGAIAGADRSAADIKGGITAARQAVADALNPKPKPKPKPKPTEKPPAPEQDTTPGGRMTVHELGSLDEALERARAEGKLLALVFTLPEQTRREPDVQAIVEALRSPSLKATAPRFLYVWQPLCDDLGLDTKDAEAWRAQKSPSLVVLDPWAEVKEGERRPALVSVNKVADVPGELGRALIEAARAGHPPAKDEGKKE